MQGGALMIDMGRLVNRGQEARIEHAGGARGTRRGEFPLAAVHRVGHSQTLLLGIHEGTFGNFVSEGSFVNSQKC